MSTIATARPALVPLGVHRINVNEYERIIVSGSLADPERVELIAGYMVDKMAKSAEHGFSTRRVLDELEDRLPPGWTSRKEEPVRIPDYDEPEPDIAIVRGAVADYEHRLPGPDDARLVAEVSLTTLDRDRNEKGPAYARGGIPVYWIINLVERQIEVYTRPGPDGYASLAVFKEGQVVPIEIDGQECGALDVRSVLPSPAADPGAARNGE